MRNAHPLTFSIGKLTVYLNNEYSNVQINACISAFVLYAVEILSLLANTSQ